jgi:hypothetical protein
VKVWSYPQSHPDYERIKNGGEPGEPGERDAIAVLLREIGRLHTENVKLRGRVRALDRSRDRWRAEAKAWKWGAMQR